MGEGECALCVAPQSISGPRTGFLGPSLTKTVWIWKRNETRWIVDELEG